MERIVDTDTQGNQVVPRVGTNGFTCMPGNPRVIGQPPMCADAPSLQWFADFKARKPNPTNTVPGITYMLAGATQRSDSDPYDTASTPQGKPASFTCSRPAKYGATKTTIFLVMCPHTSWCTHPILKNSDIAVAAEEVWRPDRVGRPDAYLIFQVGGTWTKP
jgi:hypothetical protein